MTTFSDKELNALLGGIGSMPTLSTPKKRMKALPLTSSSIQRGKGFDSGSVYDNSPYLKIADELSELSTGFTGQVIDESTTKYAEAAREFIAYVEKGDPEKGFAPLHIDLMPFATASKNVLDGKPASNIVEVLFSYRSELYKATKRIDQFHKELVGHYEELIKKRVFDSNRLSIDFLLKETKATRETVNLSSRILSAKEIVIARNKALAETIQYPDHKLAPAYLYARLLVMNIRYEESKREREILSYVVAKDEECRNQGYEPTPEEREGFKFEALDFVEKKSQGGFSSIQALFPVGIIQFMEYTGSGRIRTVGQAGQNFTAWFEAPRGLTPAEVASWQALEKEVVDIVEGTLNGLKINEKEDRYGNDVSGKVPTQAQVAHRNPVAQAHLLATKFDKGSKVWLGGNKRATASLVNVYKSGVSVFFEGSRNI